MSGLPYGWAIVFGTVRFDGCDDKTGFPTEAKADIDFLFDENDDLKWWVKPEKNPAIQMMNQARQW